MSESTVPARSGSCTRPSSDPSGRASTRTLVVLEQTLGHVTHGQNLVRLLSEVEGFEPTFAPIDFDVDGWRGRVPGFGNWTVRAGVRARRVVRHLRRGTNFDAMFVHTQVPAVLLGRPLGDVPMIISLDATPKQYDDLGDHYAHEVGPQRVEQFKTWLNRRCFERAAHLVVWADWTKHSLIDDYGIDADRITVIPPGVDADRWARPAAPGESRSDLGASPPSEEHIVRILFVGGDLRRKGGHHALRAFERLRVRHGDQIELHLVTPSPVDAADGVQVYDSMKPNSAELIELYHRCDIFCLPTLGDCLPMVLAEAGAAGLALVSTDVGAIREIVRDTETGLLVPVDDPDAVEQALERLIVDPELRARLAARASETVSADHDAARNASRLAEIIRDAASR
jgi:glycosyltransferase involved in cell wall biosynthesis